MDSGAKLHWEPTGKEKSSKNKEQISFIKGIFLSYTKKRKKNFQQPLSIEKAQTETHVTNIT